MCEFTEMDQKDILASGEHKHNSSEGDSEEDDLVSGGERVSGERWERELVVRGERERELVESVVRESGESGERVGKWWVEGSMLALYMCELSVFCVCSILWLLTC